MVKHLPAGYVSNDNSNDEYDYFSGPQKEYQPLAEGYNRRRSCSQIFKNSLLLIGIVLICILLIFAIISLTYVMIVNTQTNSISSHDNPGILSSYLQIMHIFNEMDITPYSKKWTFSKNNMHVT